jgi:hypothetical protein
VVRDLFHLVAGQVERIDVQRQVAVGNEVDLVAPPGRMLVGAGKIGQAPRGVLRQVIDPDVLGPAALIAFPGAELPLDGSVDDLAGVGGKRAAAAFRDRQRRFQAAVQGDQEKPAHALAPRGAVAAHQDLAAVGGPVHDHVVVAAARRHDADIVVIGQLPRRAAGGRHDVHLPRAGVFAREGDPAAIGRDLGEELQAGMRRQAPGVAARCRDRPDVAGIDKDDQVAVYIGEPEQAGVGDSPHRTAQEQDSQCQAKKISHDASSVDEG